MFVCKMPRLHAFSLAIGKYNHALIFYKSKHLVEGFQGLAKSNKKATCPRLLQ